MILKTSVGISEKKLGTIYIFQFKYRRLSFIFVLWKSLNYSHFIILTYYQLILYLSYKILNLHPYFFAIFIFIHFKCIFEFFISNSWYSCWQTPLHSAYKQKCLLSVNHNAMILLKQSFIKPQNRSIIIIKRGD